MPGKIRLVYNKKNNELAIRQTGVDIDDMAIGFIFNVYDVTDESKTAPQLSRAVQMVKAFDLEDRTVAWFWRSDIESVEVIE